MNLKCPKCSQIIAINPASLLKLGKKEKPSEAKRLASIANGKKHIKKEETNEH